MKVSSEKIEKSWRMSSNMFDYRTISDIDRAKLTLVINRNSIAPKTFLECPICNKNFSDLYRTNKCEEKFACRKCLKLSYESQNNTKTKADRLASKIVKLRRKLFGTDNDALNINLTITAANREKPKRTRYATFNSAIERIINLENEYLSILG